MSHLSGFSFREKSACISLGVILVVYIPYFIHIWKLVSQNALTLASVFSIFTGALVFQILLAIGAHIAISIRERATRKDERDSAIESKAFRNAYLALSYAICFAAAFVALMELTVGRAASESLYSPVLVTQILLLCLVVAEATKYATQVVCYRRGI